MIAAEIAVAALLATAWDRHTPLWVAGLLVWAAIYIVWLALLHQVAPG